MVISLIHNPGVQVGILFSRKNFRSERKRKNKTKLQRQQKFTRDDTGLVFFETGFQTQVCYTIISTSLLPDTHH